MKRTMVGVAFLLGFAATALPARATLLHFAASLDGAQQVPTVVTPGTGSGTVVLDDVAGTITVDMSFQNLTTNAILAHIHGPAAVGMNAPILFPFTGVPTATSGVIPEQVFLITPMEITQLESGLFYFNVHSMNFPGGEIRGQIMSVPEPGTLALLAGGAIGLAMCAKRRTRA